MILKNITKTLEKRNNFSDTLSLLNRTLIFIKDDSPLTSSLLALRDEMASATRHEFMLRNARLYCVGWLIIFLAHTHKHALRCIQRIFYRVVGEFLNSI